MLTLFALSLISLSQILPIYSVQDINRVESSPNCNHVRSMPTNACLVHELDNFTVSYHYRCIDENTLEATYYDGANCDESEMVGNYTDTCGNGCYCGASAGDNECTVTDVAMTYCGNDSENRPHEQSYKYIINECVAADGNISTLFGCENGKFYQQIYYESGCCGDGNKIYFPEYCETDSSFGLAATCHTNDTGSEPTTTLEEEIQVWHGGYGGNLYKMESGISSAYITKICVGDGDVIDQIQVWFNNGESIGPYGGPGGEYSCYQVSNGNCILSVNGREGDLIDSLQFFSGDGTSSPYWGSYGGIPFSEHGTACLKSLYVRTGLFVDGLQFNWHGDTRITTVEPTTTSEASEETDGATPHCNHYLAMPVEECISEEVDNNVTSVQYHCIDENTLEARYYYGANCNESELTHNYTGTCGNGCYCGATENECVVADVAITFCGNSSANSAEQTFQYIINGCLADFDNESYMLGCENGEFYQEIYNVSNCSGDGGHKIYFPQYCEEESGFEVGVMCSVGNTEPSFTTTGKPITSTQGETQSTEEPITTLVGRLCEKEHVLNEYNKCGIFQFNGGCQEHSSALIFQDKTEKMSYSKCCAMCSKMSECKSFLFGKQGGSKKNWCNIYSVECTDDGDTDWFMFTPINNADAICNFLSLKIKTE